MAFKWIKAYKSQIILTSAVSGVLLGYQWIPKTAGLFWSERETGFHDGKPEIQTLSDTTLSLIEQVKADLRAQGDNEQSFERCRFFKMNSMGWMYNNGTTRIRTGAIIGIPFVFEMTLPQLVPYLTRVIPQDRTKNDWNSQAGQQYIKNVVLSDNAKKFAIAWQLNYVNSFYLFGRSFLGVSVVWLYFIQSKRSHMKFFTSENLTRKAEKAQKASDKDLGFHRTLTDWDRHKIFRAYNFYIQAGLGLSFIVLYHILFYSYRWYLDKSMDRKTGKLGEEYVLGGIEFYDKVLEKNKAQRDLMDFGTSYFKKNGDDIQGYLFSPYWPASKARDLLVKMLKSKES